MKTKFTLSLLALLSSIGAFAQGLASIAPRSAFVSTNTSVTIKGNGTKFLTGTNTITFISGTDVSTTIVFSNQNVVDDSTIMGTVAVSSNAKFGSYIVRIANNINPVINIISGFVVHNPDTTPSFHCSIGPMGDFKGSSFYLDISGNYTHFKSSKKNIIKFYKYGVESFAISNQSLSTSSDGKLNASCYVDIKAPLGWYTVSIENEIDGILFDNKGFTISNEKSISNISRDFGRRNDTVSIGISGIKTNFNLGTPILFFTKDGLPSNDINVFLFEPKGADQAVISVKVNPNANLGNYDLVYFNTPDDTIVRASAFTVTAGTGINEFNETVSNVYPNPAKDFINIESKQNLKSISIYDLTGKLCLSKSFQRDLKTYTIEIGQEQLVRGLYLINIENEESSSAQKLIIE